jgi:hypothetical protein
MDNIRNDVVYLDLVRQIKQYLNQSKMAARFVKKKIVI